MLAIKDSIAPDSRTKRGGYCQVGGVGPQEPEGGNPGFPRDLRTHLAAEITGVHGEEQEKVALPPAVPNCL